MPVPDSARKPEFQTSDRWLIRAGLLLALGISLFLAWNSLQGGGIPGCGPESGCNDVLNSRWSKTGPIPVSALGKPDKKALRAQYWGDSARQVN